MIATALILFVYACLLTDDQCPNEDKILLEYDDVREISSANYPMDYANNMYCRWVFQGPPGSVVVVRIMDFDLNR